ncbi:MAG: HlyD family efflux transporter periplasmic adaptor subunit [Bryobacterales bacterium]|nr:HlyD family efflux transporter periplasmic adaptor subunit [Bryobacterales bacterium]
MKRILLIAFILTASCSRFEKEQPKDHVFVSGRIEGDEIDLAFKLSGRIGEILVREGDTVKAGQVIARLTGDQEVVRLREAEARLAGAQVRVVQARAQVGTIEQRVATTRLQQEQAESDAPPRVSQAEAQLAALRAELERARADEKQVRADAKRYSDLAEKGAVSKQLAEQQASRVSVAAAAVEAVQRQIAAAQSAVNVTRATLRNPAIRAAEAQTYERQIAEARAGIRAAQTEVAAAEAAVDRARADVNELELKAPVDGTVITRTAEPGRVVAAGATVLTLIDLSRLYLRAFVPEDQIGLVKLGQRAQVFIDSAPKTPLEAEVMRVDPQAMFTPENTYFQQDRVKQVVGVKLRLSAVTGAAKPGMPADGRILLGS